MKMLRNALLAAAAAATFPAAAQFMPPPPGPYLPFYIGAGIGQGTLDTNSNAFNDLNGVSVGSKETTYTVRAGWRFNPYFAVELAYYDLGKYDFHARPAGTTADIDGSVKVKSYGAALVGILPIDQFDLYGRIGWVRTKSEAQANSNLSAFPANGSNYKSDANYGVGGRWNFTPQWGLFAEWTKNDNVKVDSYLIGIDWRF
jgi:OmpA-OmpF porin, OOP family